MNLSNECGQQAANDNDHHMLMASNSRLQFLGGQHPAHLSVAGHDAFDFGTFLSRNLAMFRSCNTDDFSEVECLECLISFSSKQADARTLAEQAMATYGSLARVFQQPSQELCEMLGLDAMTAFLMKITKTSMKHLVAPCSNGRREIASHDALVEYLSLDFRDADQEILKVIYLDAKCKVIQDEEMSRGTVDTVPVYPREIGKRALSCAAHSVILAHNHLTDDPTPSNSDIEATIRINAALQSLDIVLNDHVIIAHDQSFSMRAEGLF